VLKDFVIFVLFLLFTGEGFLQFIDVAYFFAKCCHGKQSLKKGVCCHCSCIPCLFSVKKKHLAKHKLMRRYFLFVLALTFCCVESCFVEFGKMRKIGNLEENSGKLMCFLVLMLISNQQFSSDRVHNFFCAQLT